MKYLKSQKGSALAIALIIVVLFSVLGLGLVTLNASASKQINNKEQEVQARHLAEMGLVHYKSEAIKALSAHNIILDGFKKNNSLTEEQKIKAINEENNKICYKLTGLPIVNTVNLNDPNYDISIKNCQPNSNKTKVDITVNSEGKSSQGKIVNIDLDLSVTLPDLTVENRNNIIGSTVESNTPPAEPIPPENGVNKSWPCTDKHCGTVTVNKFTDVSDLAEDENVSKGKGNGNNKYELFVQKGNLTFMDSLVMMDFEVGGGNELNLTVEKDFYIKGTFKIQNHACIMVKRNFTSLNSISFGTKSYLFVYGDANLNSSDIHKKSAIYVSGDVYINGVKQNPKPYSPVPSSSDDCSLPGASTNETSNKPLNINVEAQLFTNEYRY